MFARLDGSPQVNGSEAGRRCEQYHVTLIDHFLEGIQSDKFVRVRDGHLLFNPFVGLQVSQTRIDGIEAEIRHGDQFALGIGLQRFPCRTGSAAAAADETDLQLIASGRKQPGTESQIKTDSPCNRRSCFQKISS